MASICVANFGNGSDMGSLDLKWDESLTGPLLGVASGGLSSHRGVPGREVSETSSAPATDEDPLGLK